MCCAESGGCIDVRSEDVLAPMSLALVSDAFEDIPRPSTGDKELPTVEKAIFSVDMKHFCP